MQVRKELYTLKADAEANEGQLQQDREQVGCDRGAEHHRKEQKPPK